MKRSSPSQLAVVVLFLAAFVSGCDSVSTDTESGVVVEAYLEANASFGPVRLSRTVGINERYDFASLAVSDAEVEIRLIGEDDAIGDIIVYAEAPNEPGVYHSLGGGVVSPLATYELFATVPGTGEVLRSRTRIPGAFDVIEAGPDTVEYQGPRQIEILTTRSIYPGRQAIFVFSTQSLDPRIDTLTPFYYEVVEPDNDSDDDELADYLINESPPLNENGYQIDAVGNLRITVPWLAFAFYGPNQLRMNAIDDNIFDFVRSQSVQQGGSTLAPGEVPNVLDHVDGGLGVFGSYARAAINVELLRPSR